MFWSERNELPISMRLKRVKLLEPAQLFEEQKKTSHSESRETSVMRTNYSGLMIQALYQLQRWTLFPWQWK